MSRRTKSKNKSKRNGRQRAQGHHPSGLLRPVATTVVPKDRISSLKPMPSPDESGEDIAILSKASRVTLAPELQREADAVVEALEQVSTGEFERAVSSLSGISRVSPYSDWRLFVRGLVAFYQHDKETACQNWARLDRKRRPARIANTLLLSVTDKPLDETMVGPAQDLVETAQSVLEFREAIAAATQIASVKHRDNEASFSVSQVAMLLNLRENFSKVASEFVTAFSQACVRLCTFQPYSDVFELIQPSVTGPKNDPRWNLLAFNYYRQFEDAGDSVHTVANDYLQGDLPKLSHLAEDVRGALASTILVKQARIESERKSGRSLNYGFKPGNPTKLEDLLTAAIKSYPKNRLAHQLLIESYERQLKGLGDLEIVEKKRFRATEAMVEQFGDEVERMLYLIDCYFEEEEIEKAEKLVHRLNQMRHDDPVVKALPWKLKIREAMFLSRRKNQLNQARQSLADAESIWPQWLDRRQLLFLRAAVELRAGNKARFDELNAAAREQCGCESWVADVMMFAAMQQMNIPNTELKPHRESILARASDAYNVPLDELCSLGAFFWDLNRVAMKHKAYRIHASNFGKILSVRLYNGEIPGNKPVFLESLGWLALHDFWSEERYPIPTWLDSWMDEPKAVAAALEPMFRNRLARYEMSNYSKQIELLATAAEVESDPFYRYRFETIARKSRELVASVEAQDRFASRRFHSSMEDDDEDYLEDELTDESFCNCPSCRAERAAQALDSEYDEDEDEDDELDEDFNRPASNNILGKVIAQLGPRGVEEFMRMSVVARETNNSKLFINQLVGLLSRYGFSLNDIEEFVKAMADVATGRQSQEPSVASLETIEPSIAASTMPSRPITAEERRAFDKKRKKELQDKRRR